MLFSSVVLNTLFLTHLTTLVANCKNVKKKQIFLSKKFRAIEKCSDLKPESATADTICLSSCAKSYNDPSIQCNVSANAWNYDLVPENPATYSTLKGHEGCGSDESRYKCVAIKNASKECDQIKFLNSGDYCYTKCGQDSCPSTGFKEPTNEDFKRGDCKEGYRIRCVAIEKVNVGNAPRKFVIELETHKHK